MYKDLINKIVKYLKPKERYYLFLEIIDNSKFSDQSFYVHHFRYHFYLIYELNGEIREKQNITCLDLFPNIFPPGYCSVYAGIKNNCFILGLCQNITDIVNPYFFFFLYERMKLKIISYSDILSISSDTPVLYDPKTLTRFNFNISEYVNTEIPLEHTAISTIKINKKSIKFIKEGMKSFEKICKISYPKEEDLTDEDRKYVKIYYP